MRESLLLLAALLAACGGGDDSFDAPTCTAGEVKIQGTIDGMDVTDDAVGPTSYIFVNAINGQPGSLEIMFPGDQSLSLTWDDLVANGASTSARGAVQMPADDIDLGNCDDQGLPGVLRMNAAGGGGQFLLRDLRPDPYCTSSTVDGEITGCFESSSST